MKLLCLLLSFTYVNCFYNGSNQPIKEKIIGGMLARPESVPHFVGLYYNGTYFCGSGAISPGWLLSALMCFEHMTDPLIFLRAIAGSIFRTIGKILVCKDVLFSSTFNAPEAKHSLALVELRDHIVFNELRKPIPLSQTDVDPVPYKNMIISGFGKTHRMNLGLSASLILADVKVLPRSECFAYSAELFCATSKDNDVCVGDLGGPAVIDGRLFGIITSTIDCGNGVLPRIYAKVGIFTNWIRFITGLPFDD